MVIVFPAKKPKLEICEYKYCDGNHQILKFDETKCHGNHAKSKKVKKAKNGPNPYLKFALSNSMGQRFAQEKIQRQLVQNEQKFWLLLVLKKCLTHLQMKMLTFKIVCP